MKILFCPAHFRYTDKAGSEFYSSFNNAHRIASAYTDSVVIAGKSDVADVPYRIIETQKQKPDDWMKKIEDWSTLNSISFALSYFVAGYRLLRREKFDVIHHIRPFAVGTTFNFLPFFAPNTPFVIGAFASPYEKQFLVGEKKSKWSDHLFSLVLLIAAPALRQLSLRTLKRANAILVTDYETKALIAKSIPQEKIHVIPHGKDKRHFYLNPAKFEIPSINLLIVGNLIKRKRIDLAIHAFATAAKKNRNLFLHIAGDGLERSVLEKLVRDLHIEQRATFHGAIPFEKMRDLYSASHILLHTPTEEMFAHVYLEALASGIPIISTPTLGARNILTQETSIITSDRPNEIAEKILELVADTDRLKTMSLEARKYFEETFDLDTVVIPQILTTYRTISSDTTVNDAKASPQKYV